MNTPHETADCVRPSAHDACTCPPGGYWQHCPTCNPQPRAVAL